MGDSVGDRPRIARIKRDGAFSFGYNDAAAGRVDKTSRNPDYRAGVDAWKKERERCGGGR